MNLPWLSATRDLPPASRQWRRPGLTIGLPQVARWPGGPVARWRGGRTWRRGAGTGEGAVMLKTGANSPAVAAGRGGP